MSCLCSKNVINKSFFSEWTIKLTKQPLFLDCLSSPDEKKCGKQYT